MCHISDRRHLDIRGSFKSTDKQQQQNHRIMKIKQLLPSLLVALTLCLPATVQAKVTHLLPKAQMVELTGGTAFALGRTVTITDPTNSTLLQKFFTDNGCTVAGGGAQVTVTLVSSIDGAYDYTLAGYDNEAYTLEITADAINITAITKTGVIRAAQTLAQLAEGYEGTPVVKAGGEILTPNEDSTYTITVDNDFSRSIFPR